MNRIKLTVAYDGTEFCGFAPQREQRTVHGTLTEAVRQAVGEDVEIVGGSRTDGGAHARGQVCHFDTKNPMPGERWKRALNTILPEDCRIVRSERVDDRFHSRFSASSRHYEYRILTTHSDPFRSRYAHAHWEDLDVDLMREAAKHLVGNHDFRAFTEELEPSIENTRRVLYSVEVDRCPYFAEEIRINVRGTAFLRGMMRRMAGALFEIGRGFRDIETLPRLLTDERKGMQWPVVLPAKGLTLMEIRYDKPDHDARTAPLPTYDSDE